MIDDETDRLRSALSGMRVVGLVGGVASGKSLVAKQLEELGALRLDADQAAHTVLLEKEVEEAARGRWGESIIGADGHIDRRRLGQIVFAASENGQRERACLERLTHPRIARMLEQQVLAAREKNDKVAVLDAPVLLEAGWDRLCDTIIYVDANQEGREQRMRARGWTPDDFKAREAAQKSLTEKRARAEEVIDNSGSVEATRAQVLGLWRRWLAE
jgi:dephospho-CoA kinase